MQKQFKEDIAREKRRQEEDAKISAQKIKLLEAELEKYR